MSVRIPNDLRDAIAVMAEREDAYLSDLIRELLQEAVDARRRKNGRGKQ
jgi:predicted HicB family RNase H-like nuclease